MNTAGGTPVLFDSAELDNSRGVTEGWPLVKIQGRINDKRKPRLSHVQPYADHRKKERETITPN